MKKNAGLVVDIGNTSFRLALCEYNKITERSSFMILNSVENVNVFNRCIFYFKSKFDLDVYGIALASVSSSDFTSLYSFLLKREFPNTPITVISGDMENLPLKLAAGFTQKKKVGADRLANAMAAIALKKYPCVIADFGTALTVDGVNEKGEFVGGMILPGMTTLLRAMHQNTAQLPDLAVPPKPFAKPFGQNTKDAMLAGAEHGYRGLVRETVQTLQRALGGKVNLLATGGMAERVATASGLEFEILPDLTLLGIAQVLKGVPNEQ